MGDFECDNCGKNSVDKPGKWCDDCQKREYYETQKYEAEWYSKSRKCQTCHNADGCDPTDKCIHYKMPLSMVARKKKCKHFKEIDYSKEVMEDY